jgi:pimeloyl-[acyl-carrier protein] methyl ester esterase
MKPLLLFVHGWGFDASIWQDLRACFAPEDTLAWDLGFFGAPSQTAPPSGRPVLAVGHSFGLLWLLHEHILRRDGLISINGFSCFAQRPDFPAGIAPRVLARMRARIASDAASVVADFRALCGVTAPLPGEPDRQKLLEVLESLQNWDERPAQVIAALCGATDNLVSQAMSRACFADATMHWHEAGHMLPLSAPAWCAGFLRKLADNFS